jgi:peroxiredoxin
MKTKLNSPCPLLLSLLLIMACSAVAAEPPTTGQAAPDFTLKTMDAKTVTLSTETAKFPVVLVVLRGWPGYQCPLCTRQVHEFVAQAESFAGKSRVIMVYPGPADELKAHAEQFLKDKQWPAEFRFVIDPDYAFTKSYGLRWEAPGETSYPSAFVIDKKGIVRFAKTSKTHGGRATVVEIQAALKKLP